jgi:hypothetical protein
MERSAKLQFIGPAALFLTVLAGEGAAYALQLFPSVPQLWFINLVGFGMLQRSYYVLGGVFDVAYFQLLCVALPLFGLACYGLFFHRPLALAIASNLTLVYTCFLLFSWCAFEPAIQALSARQEAALTVIGLPTQPDFYVCIALLVFSLVSVLISHGVYLRDLSAARKNAG